MEHLEQLIADLHDKLHEVEQLTYEIEAEIVKLHGRAKP